MKSARRYTKRSFAKQNLRISKNLVFFREHVLESVLHEAVSCFGWEIAMPFDATKKSFTAFLTGDIEAWGTMLIEAQNNTLKRALSLFRDLARKIAAAPQTRQSRTSRENYLAFRVGIETIAWHAANMGLYLDNSPVLDVFIAQAIDHIALVGLHEKMAELSERLERIERRAA